MKSILFLFISLFLFKCSHQKHVNQEKSGFYLDTLAYYDVARNRKISIAIYQPKNKKLANKIPVIFNHGYGANRGFDYLKYSYLNEYLASKGYFVLSIQHELPTDELLPSEGKPQIVRRSNWERGTDNIFFVIKQMNQEFPTLDYQKLTLIGHSNGGDMIALFGQKYPELVAKIITLDNRRMALPRTSKPQIFTLRCSDFPADEGVLPTKEEIEKYKISIDFTPIRHNDMDDDAKPEERTYLTTRILKYLQN